MRAKVHRDRSYDAGWTVVSDGIYRGVFDVDSTSATETDGVINEATSETFPTHEAAEEAADAAAKRWIDSEADKT